MFRPESTLNARALRREAVQLGIVAAVTAAALAASSSALHVLAGVVDVLALVLTAIASVVAWRVGGRGASVGLYVGAVLVFLALALANFAA